VSRRRPDKVGPVHTSTGAALRSGGIAVGGLAVVVFVAVGVGAVAARSAPPGVTLPAALIATTVSALLAGLAAGPVLCRLRQRQQPGPPGDHARPSAPPGGVGGDAAPLR
jgi:hypothetical protein